MFKLNLKIMNNCLVTKLKAEVQNDELNYLGMMKIKAIATENSTGFEVSCPFNSSLDIKSKTPVSLYKQGYMGKGDVIATDVTSYTWNNDDSNYTRLFISVPNDGVEHTYYISKYNINIIAGDNLFFDIEQIVYSDKLVDIRANLEGTIKELSTTSLRNVIILPNSAVIGDLTSIVNRNTISILALNNTYVAIDFDKLNGECGQSIREMYLQYNNNVKGELYSWLQKIHDTGRTSGSVIVNMFSTSATIDGQIPQPRNYVVTFTSDGFTVE